MKKNITIIAALILLSVGMGLERKLRPWMPAGQTVHVGSWKFRGYDFEVWQQKNAAIWEPFRTAIFVRPSDSERWKAFSLGHQDCYRPRITLTLQDSGVLVLRGRDRLGLFDFGIRSYIRTGQSGTIDEGTTDSPEAWW